MEEQKLPMRIGLEKNIHFVLLYINSVTDCYLLTNFSEKVSLTISDQISHILVTLMFCYLISTIKGFPVLVRLFGNNYISLKIMFTI